MENVDQTTKTEEVIPTKRIRPSNLRHREIINQLVYYHKTPVEIAEMLGFSRGGIDHIIRSPLFQVELQKELTIKQRIERDAVIQRVASTGVQKLEEAVTTGKLTFTAGDKVEEKVLDGREIVAIIHDALDRTGHKPVTKVIEGHIDLGSMIIQAHNQNSETSDDGAVENEIIDIQREPDD